MAFCGASAWSKVALILTLLALACHCGGFGTNYWMARHTVRDKLNFGIGLWWKTDCLESCETTDIPSEYITSLMWATRVLESVTTAALFATLLCLGFYVVTDFSRKRRMAVVVMLLAFFAAILSVAGMICWIKNLPENHYPSWSMGLTVFAITMTITSAILLIPDICQYDYKTDAKMGGEFKNLSVAEATRITKKQPEPEPVVEGEANLKPKIIPQHPLAAPSYQFMQYNKRKLYDGF